MEHFVELAVFSGQFLNVPVVTFACMSTYVYMGLWVQLADFVFFLPTGDSDIIRSMPDQQQPPQ